LYIYQSISNLSFLYACKPALRFFQNIAAAACPALSVDLVSLPDITAVDIPRYGVVGKNTFHYIRHKLDYRIPENQGYANQDSDYNNDFNRSQAVLLGHKGF
jgi:hypothetical protein